MDMREGLNPEQVRALEITSGPLLILAGAGSGKTKTLTHRIAHLIAHTGVWPDEILAVTFTNKAAREMRERLWRFLETSRHTAVDNDTLHQLQGEERSLEFISNEKAEGQTPPRSFMQWMGTFHGICVRILRYEGEAIGIKTNFVIYDEDDRQGLIKQVMRELSITTDQIKPRAVSAAISSAKNELIDPEAYASTARYPNQQQIAKIYELYERRRDEAGALDFDDLLMETVRLLRDVPEVRQRYQTKFKQILIDEYQDTNAAQYTIVKLLVNDQKNICVVGDDWQSVYSWRGADYTNILNFERDFPGTTVIKLEQNYRSTKAILDAAHSVITKNIERTDKKLWTEAEHGSPVAVTAVYDETDEAFQVASRITAQVAIGARRYDDFAVLYRTNAQSFAFERVFLQHHIPYHIVGGVRFYDRKEIKDMIAYLRLIYQPNDRMSFSRIVNIPTRGIGQTSFEKFISWQANSGMDIITGLVNADQASSLTPRARRALVGLGELLGSLQTMVIAQASPRDIIERLIEGVKYREFILDGTPQAEDRETNLGVLVSDVQSWVTLEDFLAEAALMSSADTDAEQPSVTLMTLHAAKGLEFPVVFMVGMEDGLFPSSRALEEGPKQLEEERRLCYVGMTRAREELHLSYAQSRAQFGQRSYGMPSRFLADMGHQLTQRQTPALPKFGSDDLGDYVMMYDIGDRVRSQQFGIGDVVDIDGLAVSVHFTSGQTRKLNTEFARLEKIDS